MQRTEVRSSNLKSVGFDSMASILEIEFRSGDIYQYTGVRVTIHTELMRASSKGKYFAQKIRDKFPYRQIR